MPADCENLSLSSATAAALSGLAIVFLQSLLSWATRVAHSEAADPWRRNKKALCAQGDKGHADQLVLTTLDQPARAVHTDTSDRARGSINQRSSAVAHCTRPARTRPNQFWTQSGNATSPRSGSFGNGWRGLSRFDNVRGPVASTPMSNSGVTGANQSRRRHHMGKIAKRAVGLVAGLAVAISGAVTATGPASAATACAVTFKSYTRSRPARPATRPRPWSAC